MRVKYFGLAIPMIVFIALFAEGMDLRLIDAVKNRDKPAIGSLLRQRVDVNAPETDGTTALHWAVRRDDVETADLLIRAGAKVKVANRYGVTALSLACTNGNAALIQLLLKGGADPNTTLPEGETALMTAARTGKVDAAKVLLDAGADVNATEGVRGQTALMWAAAEGHAATVDALIADGANIRARSRGGFTALLFAVRDGRAEAVRSLLKAGADVNEVVQDSGRFADVAITDRNPLSAGNTALSLAITNAHFELAAALLDAGANPNAAGPGWSPLHQITWVRKPGSGTNRPAPEGSGNMDSIELVRRLVAHGANVNARMTKGATVETRLNMNGATPFLMAARTADTELMRLFVKLGADPLIPNASKTTPLLVAAGIGTIRAGVDPGTESEVLEAVKIAFELGGDVNAVDDNGDTAMHGAAYKEAPSVVRFLVDKGAKVEVWNRKNRLGETPLKISQGVLRGDNIRYHSAEMAAALRQVMTEAGVSTALEP